MDKPSYMVIACAFGAATLLLQNLYSLEIFQYYALPPEVLHSGFYGGSLSGLHQALPAGNGAKTTPMRGLILITLKSGRLFDIGNV